MLTNYIYFTHTYIYANLWDNHNWSSYILRRHKQIDIRPYISVFAFGKCEMGELTVRKVRKRHSKLNITINITVETWAWIFILLLLGEKLCAWYNDMGIIPLLWFNLNNYSILLLYPFSIFRFFTLFIISCPFTVTISMHFTSGIKFMI